MPKQLQITIPEPCHENWAEMTHTQQGAYCKVCSKNVIDFTTKTENEIYDILTQSDGNTCGRFTSFQLQQPIRKTEVNNGWFNWRAIAASLAALVAFEETQAQQNHKNKKHDIVCLPEIKIHGARTLKSEDMVQGGVSIVSPTPEISKGISGKVIDAQTKEPLYMAEVFIRASGTNVFTDTAGQFALIADPDAHKNDTIVVQYIGYETHEIPVAEFLKNNNKVLEIKLEYRWMGLVEVVKTSKAKHPKRKLRNK